MKRVKTLLSIGLLMAVAASAAVSAELGPRTSNESGVTVVITPQNLTDGATTWDFRVVFDTHSGELNDDLVKSSVLLVGNQRVAPASWDGAAPGGHHREGILKFTPVKPLPKSIELQLQRPSEAKPRRFSWALY